MFTFSLFAAAAVGGAVLGVYGLPVAKLSFKSWSAARAVANAKALIAKAEAEAKALEAARAVVAATPPPAA